MFHWLESHYQFLVVGIPAILGALWKWVLMPVIAFKNKAKAWFVRDETIKGSMEEFIKRWSPEGGESSGWERLERIETSVGLLQSVSDTRDKLDQVCRFTCDVGGHVLTANRAFCRYFNITEDVATGWGWINLFSPEGSARDDFRRRWLASIESDVEFNDVVKTNPHYDKNGPAVEILASPVRDQTLGKIIRWDGILQPPSKTS